jgi:hypothetical protein
MGKDRPEGVQRCFRRFLTALADGGRVEDICTPIGAVQHLAGESNQNFRLNAEGSLVMLT